LIRINIIGGACMRLMRYSGHYQSLPLWKGCLRINPFTPKTGGNLQNWIIDPIQYKVLYHRSWIC
jgi:hypothetical protein